MLDSTGAKIALGASRGEVEAREESVAYSIEQLQKLEDKLSKVVEIFRQAQAQNVTLTRQVEKMQADLAQGGQRQEALEREVLVLRREREDVRQRLEKLLERVEELTKQNSAG
jgi:chromosome segregation ATPase